MQNATQQNIDIAGIRDGIIILRDGGYRLILQTSAVNFSLKSEEEQNSIIFQYQSFLNSLHFPIEIVMQSKKLDLTPYLKKIKDKMQKQNNELLRVQMQDYMEFVSKLINIANIMKKSFYVVVPYEPINLKNATLIDKLFRNKPTGPVRISESEFESHKDELMQRANVVASGLGGIGLHCTQLSTEQIIEVFYKIYNPEVAGKERVEEANLLTSQVVSMKQNEEQIQSQQQVPLSQTQGNEQVIDNSAVVMQAQKSKVQQEKMKEMKEAGFTGKAENKASTLDTTAQNDQTKEKQS